MLRERERWTIPKLRPAQTPSARLSVERQRVSGAKRPVRQRVSQCPPFGSPTASPSRTPSFPTSNTISTQVSRRLVLLHHCRKAPSPPITEAYPAIPLCPCSGIIPRLPPCAPRSLEHQITSWHTTTTSDPTGLTDTHTLVADLPLPRVNSRPTPFQRSTSVSERQSPASAGLECTSILLKPAALSTPRLC